MRAEVAQIIGTRLEWRCMPPPDLILHNGKIITLDQSSRIAQAISVRAGQVVAVGDDAALLKEAAPTSQRIDLAGRSVLPGFFDAHPHADREGLKARGGIPIAGLHSVADIVEVVKRTAQTTAAGEWIVLMPMGEPPHEYISRPEQLVEGRFPTRHDLDAVAPDHAVYIRAVWGWWSRRPFPSVANSLALGRAGVTRDTPAPHNVEIVTDARGEPTGVFLEKNFVPILEYTLFRACIPRSACRAQPSTTNGCSICSTIMPALRAGGAAATISCASKASISAVMPTARSRTSLRRATHTTDGRDIITKR